MVMNRFKNLREVFDGYKHKVQMDGDVCRMTINSVGHDDVGEVECRAFNKADVATSRAKLTIHGTYNHLRVTGSERSAKKCSMLCRGLY